MELFQLVCPGCGADISLGKETVDCFCPYCGKKFKFDDGVQHFEHTINYRDEARLKELEIEEQEKRKNEQRRLKEERRKEAERLRELHIKRRWVIVLGVWFGVTVAILFLYFILDLYNPGFEPIGFLKTILIVIGVIVVLSPIIIPAFYPYEYAGRGKSLLWIIWTGILFVVLFACVGVLRTIFT